MRQPIVAGNWKMNLRSTEAAAWMRDIKHRLAGPPAVEVVAAPSFTVIAEVAQAAKAAGVALAGQNLSSEEKGAHTGEVSAEMLLDCGCEAVLIGHSERRHLYGETGAMIHAKLRRALNAGLRPILCVGETLDERERGETGQVVTGQLAEALDGMEEFASGVIAYEPVWAIGTGKNATPAMAEAVHRLIRESLAARFGESRAEGQRLLYGGSVNPANAAALLAEENIDGVLVGNASLNVDSFCAIINEAILSLSGGV